MSNFHVFIVNENCDRCGKMAEELAPFKLLPFIMYYGRRIEKPWLCPKCFMAEKKKAWALKPFLNWACSHGWAEGFQKGVEAASSRHLTA